MYRRNRAMLASASAACLAGLLVLLVTTGATGSTGSTGATGATGSTTEIPQASASAMPGGGTVYRYNTPGAPTYVTVPPAGFNPFTATAQQLAEYNFPRRPTNSSALALWTDAMRRARHPIIPQHMTVGSMSFTTQLAVSLARDSE